MLGLQRPEPARLDRAARGRARGDRAPRGRRPRPAPRGRRRRSGPRALPVPARAGARAGVAEPAHGRDPSGPAGRSGPVLAGPGDHRRRDRVGGDRAAGGRGAGRRPDLGPAAVPAPRRTAPQEQPLQRRGHRGRDRAGPRGRRQGRRPGIRPTGRGALGRLRPALRQADRAFRWSDPTAAILRRIRAADGSPGVRTTLCGVELSVFDAHPGPPPHPAAAGHRADAPRRGAARRDRRRRPVDRAGPPDGRRPGRAEAARGPGARRPAAGSRRRPGRRRYPEISYRRTGPVGELRFAFYNGAMSTAQCRRLAVALRHAARDDTRVLVLAGGEVFSQRDPPGRHRGGPEPGRPRRGATSRPSTRCVGRSSRARTRSWWRRSAATPVPAG